MMIVRHAVLTALVFISSQSQIIILNVTMKSNGMSKACNVCQSEYSDISQFYAGLNTDYGDELCMDIVDSVSFIIYKFRFYATISR